MIRLIILALVCLTLCACEKTIHEAGRPMSQPLAAAK